MPRQEVGKRALATLVSVLAMAALAAAGPVSPASAAPSPAVQKHGLGDVVEPPPSAESHEPAEPVRALPKTLPESYSLEKYDEGPGDQGQVNSCTAWAIDWSAMTILENEQGIEGHPQAPMYTYAQIVKGQNIGTSKYDHFKILTSQGIDTQAHYGPSEYDYTTQPTGAERANAANWKISGYTALGSRAAAAEGIKKSIASGLPVIVSIDIHDSFYSMTQAKAASYAYMPGDASSDPVAGSHAVTVIAYDSRGVRIANSWGTNWGDGGCFNVSWSYVNQEIKDAAAVGKLVT